MRCATPVELDDAPGAQDINYRPLGDFPASALSEYAREVGGVSSRADASPGRVRV